MYGAISMTLELADDAAVPHGQTRCANVVQCSGPDNSFTNALPESARLWFHVECLLVRQKC